MEKPILLPPIPVIEATGNWYQIGKTYGAQTAMLIRSQLHTALKFRGFHQGGKGLATLSEAIKPVERNFRTRFPQEWEEFNGIADGSGIDLRLLIAAAYAEATSQSPPARAPSLVGVDGQCSGIFYPTSEFGPLVGGTTDCLPNRFLLRARPADGIGFICVMFPGSPTLLSSGMNEAGLAISGTSAQILQKKNHPVDRRMYGRDALTPMRTVLRSCRTVAEAVARMGQEDMWVYGHLAVLDRAGNAVLVESYDGPIPKLRVRDLTGEKKGFVFGNFYPWDLDPDHPEAITEPLVEMPYDSIARYQSLRRSLAQGRFTLDSMKAALTAHDGPPDKPHGFSVCNDNTVVSQVFAPVPGKAWYASQPPCLAGYVEHKVEVRA